MDHLIDTRTDRLKHDIVFVFIGIHLRYFIFYYLEKALAIRTLDFERVLDLAELTLQTAPVIRSYEVSILDLSFQLKPISQTLVVDVTHTPSTSTG